jgi:hypothetical protein
VTEQRRVVSLITCVDVFYESCELLLFHMAFWELGLRRICKSMREPTGSGVGMVAGCLNVLWGVVDVPFFAEPWYLCSHALVSSSGRVEAHMLDEYTVALAQRAVGHWAPHCSCLSSTPVDEHFRYCRYATDSLGSHVRMCPV